MNNEVFDIIWRQNILGLLKNLEDNLVRKFHSGFKEAYGYEVLLDKKKTVKKSYDKYNQILKDRYHQSDEEQRLDQHKIAACLCASLIENKLIRFHIKADIPEDLMIINYKLSFAVSASIIYEFLVDFYKDLCKKKDTAQNNKDDYRYLNPEAKLDKLKENGELFYPATNNGHKEYPVCMIRGMALNDLYGQNFDLIIYANTMFLLEQFNMNHLDRLTSMKSQ